MLSTGQARVGLPWPAPRWRAPGDCYLLGLRASAPSGRLLLSHLEAEAWREEVTTHSDAVQGQDLNRSVCLLRPRPLKWDVINSGGERGSQEPQRTLDSRARQVRKERG